MKRAVLAAGLLGILALPGLAQKIYSNSYMGKTPPDVAAPGENYVRGGTGLKLADLVGRVVYLEFSFIH